MIYDIRQELRDFTYITSVYKRIAAYHRKGHQIGRKVGDMLEILTMGGIYKSPELLDRLDTEGKLEGFTTAGHKVEFGFYQDPRRKTGLFGAIECKCVGVEETAAGKRDQALRRLKPGECFSLEFKGRWMDRPITQTLTLTDLADGRAVLKLTDSKTCVPHTLTMASEDSIRLVVDEHQTPLHTTPHGNMLEEIPGIIRLCKKVQLDSLDGDTAHFSLYNCLTGPQTIEKAKQASLVAMDLRKKVDGFWGKEEVPPQQKRMNFLHVLCEFSHWEEKSLHVISTCIDHNIIVPDAVVIKAFEAFEAAFGVDQMLDRISKKQYVAVPAVREAVEQVFRQFEDHVFFDLSARCYVRFDYDAGRLAVTPI